MVGALDVVYGFDHCGRSWNFSALGGGEWVDDNQALSEVTKEQTGLLSAFANDVSTTKFEDVECWMEKAAVRREEALV
jgi:hypothetical protein